MKSRVIFSKQGFFNRLLRPGPRVGLATASNDYQESRLTGSLPLLQKMVTGVVIIVLLGEMAA